MNRRRARNSYSEGTEKPTPNNPASPHTEWFETIDESPEFHDPYSDLSLFLSREIKKEMRHCSNPKKWSIELQDILVHRITPEFQKKFPKFRLGVSAIKKTWEKFQYFSDHINHHKDALTKDGKLNLPFLIRQNLINSESLRNTCHIHPYHYAHQLAMKMGECIAVVDGIRPKIEKITQTIWSLQRHLLPKLTPELARSPYDQNEPIDKLIAKVMIETTAKHPSLSQDELAFHVEKKLVDIQQVKEAYSPNFLERLLTALLAEHCHSPSQKMEHTLRDVPYKTIKVLRKELAKVAIDSPLSSPQTLADEVIEFFEKAHSALSSHSWDKLPSRIQSWAIQGDLIHRWIRLNHSSALYQSIYAEWREHPGEDIASIISRTSQQFIEKYPFLIAFAKEIETRCLFYCKYIWYTQEFSEEIPTYDRFIKWERNTLPPTNLSSQEMLEKVEEGCRKKLPLIPFNRTRAATILRDKKERCAK